MDDSTIKTLTVNPGDVLVVELDLGMMPQSAATRYIEQAKASIAEYFPDNKVMILPMHKSRISVVRFVDAPEDIVEDVEFTPSS